MDTDPGGTLDFIFYKGPNVKVNSITRMGGRCDPKDPTIYGSDHFALVADFEFTTA